MPPLPSGGLPRLPWSVATAVAHLPLIIKGGYRGSLVFRATVADEIAAMEALGWCTVGCPAGSRSLIFGVYIHRVSTLIFGGCDRLKYRVHTTSTHTEFITVLIHPSPKSWAVADPRLRENDAPPLARFDISPSNRGLAVRGLL